MEIHYNPKLKQLSRNLRNQSTLAEVLLWVGDLYYDGPIWLFVPESDLDAYYQSVERLCNIVHRLNTLHPAHNGPIADPGSLYLLKKALINIKNGTINGNAISGGRIEYYFEEFSLIMK